MKKITDTMLILLKYAQGMSNSQIAKLYDVPVSYIDKYSKSIDVLKEGFTAIIMTPEGEIFCHISDIKGDRVTVAIEEEFPYVIEDKDFGCVRYAGLGKRMEVDKSKITPLGEYARKCRKLEDVRLKKESEEKEKFIKSLESSRVKK